MLQIGLKGEELDLPNKDSSLWTSQSELPKNKPLTWYKVNSIGHYKNSFLKCDSQIMSLNVIENNI